MCSPWISSFFHLNRAANWYVHNSTSLDILITHSSSFNWKHKINTVVEACYTSCGYAYTRVMLNRMRNSHNFCTFDFVSIAKQSNILNHALRPHGTAQRNDKKQDTKFKSNQSIFFVYCPLRLELVVFWVQFLLSFSHFFSSGGYGFFRFSQWLMEK